MVQAREHCEHLQSSLQCAEEIASWSSLRRWLSGLSLVAHGPPGSDLVLTRCWGLQPEFTAGKNSTRAETKVVVESKFSVAVLMVK